MSRQLKIQLIVLSVVLVCIALIIGLIGQAAHKLDATSVILLCLFAVGFSTLYTWWSIRDERETNERVQAVHADLNELHLRALKGKGDTYAVVTSDALADFPAREDLDIDGLEAFRDGLLAGLLLSSQYEEVALISDEERNSADG